MPWDAEENTSGRWWAVVAILISLCSLALPYVGKARLIPGWAPPHVRLAKGIAFVPLAVAVVAALVNELVNVDSDFSGGVGSGVAMALAGGLLAVQWRAAEEPPGHRDDRQWWAAAKATAIAALVLAIGTWVAFLVEDIVGDFGYLFDDVAALLVYIAALVVMLASLGMAVVFLLSGRDSGRRVFVTFAFTTLLVALFALADDGQGAFAHPPYEKWDTPLGGTVLVGAAGALSVSRAAQRRTSAGRETTGEWIATAQRAVTLAAATLAALTGLQVLRMVWTEDFEAEVIIPMVLTGFGAGALLVARGALANVARNRVAALAVLGGVLLLGIITAAISSDQFGIGSAMAAAWFALPGLAIYALLGPSSVRTTLGPLFVASDPSGTAPAGAGARPDRPTEQWGS